MRDDSRNVPTSAVVTAADGQRVEVQLVVHPRARRISVRVCPVKRVAIATAPSKRHLKRAVDFAAERATWIARELARLPQGVSLLPGGQAPLRGAMHALVFEQGRATPRIEAGEPPRLVVPAPDADLFEKRLVRFFKAEAARDFAERCAAHAATLGVKPSRIQVKELRSRWGSCSPDGVLAFSWRVVLAPPFVLDYLAAHEVAHLQEMNHSRRFWACVKKCIPDFDHGRHWLREHGAALHSVGMVR